MKKYIAILLPLFTVLWGTAQTETQVAQTIKGKVVDKATNKAVAYTNIGIEGTFHGTASGEDGNFQLKIPEEMVSEQIYFSAVGYQKDTIQVTSLFNREFNIIKLEPQSYDIEDVDVAARSRVLIRILRMASENTTYNYIGGPFNFVCNFENEQITDDTVQVEKNAEVLVYDRTGYKEPSKSDAFRMRKYEIDQNEPDYSFSTGVTNFDELLELDWVRSATSVLNPALLDQFELSLVEETEVDGNPAWVIAFSQPEPTPAGSQDFHATAFEGEITVLKEDYFVQKIEGTAKADKQNRQGKSLAVGDSNTNYFEDVSYNFAVTYSKLKPDELSLHKNYRFNGREIEETSRLTVTEVQMSDVKEITSRDYFVE